MSQGKSFFAISLERYSSAVAVTLIIMSIIWELKALIQGQEELQIGLLLDRNQQL